MIKAQPQNSTSRTRKAVRINSTLDKGLSAYALAAGVAGVGFLALSSVAEAKIVFTPTHRIIGADASYRLDLNNDGITDFFLSNFWFASHGSYNESVGDVSVRGSVMGNRVLVTSPDRFAFADALDAGVSVGSKASFGIIRRNVLNSCRSTFNGHSRSGPWLDVRNKFLGLKFIVNGETHFGWARFTMMQVQFCKTKAVLSGYAYETVPNTPIVTGQTSSAEIHEQTGSSLQAGHDAGSATLGALALGFPGLTVWRREEHPFES